MKFIISIILFAGAALAHPPTGNSRATERGVSRRGYGISLEAAFIDLKGAVDAETKAVDGQNTVVQARGSAGLTGNFNTLVITLRAVATAINDVTAAVVSSVNAAPAVEEFARAEKRFAQAIESLTNNSTATLTGQLSSVNAAIQNATVAVEALNDALMDIPSCEAQTLGAVVARSGIVPSFKNLGLTKIQTDSIVLQSIADGKSVDPTGDLTTLAQATGDLGRAYQYLADNLDNLNYQ